jgi:hypothetical protein
MISIWYRRHWQTNVGLHSPEGDGLLRRIADGMGIEVHGVLWAIEQIEEHQLAPIKELVAALALFDVDQLAFLPQIEVR